ncbi:MAG: hypothetical protein A6F72_07890 [Cycloclasticus sp. symbiont of Poecilosclerida sp. N]|nr:MAG: hypothetical protein A6F72_07890 [Cycloclasticus sp. symbiont of Poecilosclerida sp. N]
MKVDKVVGYTVSTRTEVSDRINNEYSHMAGVFERGATPVEVLEMKTAAICILQKIKHKDPAQYSSLLKSIDVDEDAPEELAIFS